MTSEFLLEAVGYLDDELIDQARPTPVRRAVSWRRWMGLCACLALVVLMGWAAVQNLPHNSTSGSWAGATGGGSSAGAGAASGETQNGDESAASGETTPPGEPAYILLEGQSYVHTGQTARELPQGTQELGQLSLCREGASSPCTNWEEYVGCSLFEGPDGLLYLRQAQGDYLLFELVEPTA